MFVLCKRVMAELSPLLNSLVPVKLEWQQLALAVGRVELDLRVGNFQLSEL